MFFSRARRSPGWTGVVVEDRTSATASRASWLATSVEERLGWVRTFSTRDMDMARRFLEAETVLERSRRVMMGAVGGFLEGMGEVIGKGREQAGC